MSGIWLASYIVLWAVVLFQGAVIFLLLRQLGVIYLGTAQGVSRDGIATGERAPEFALRGIDGRNIALPDFRGTPLLLVFGSPTCGPCKGLIPDLNAFAREKAGELRALFLSRGDIESAQRFAREHDIEVPVAVHPDEALPEKYKTRVTPFAFIIDGEGIVRAKGLANNRAHLDMLLEMSERESHGERHPQRNGTEKEPVAVEEGARSPNSEGSGFSLTDEGARR
jgi:methylamine dehydrogenase accessory protein MauD